MIANREKLGQTYAQRERTIKLLYMIAKREKLDQAYAQRERIIKLYMIAKRENLEYMQHNLMADLLYHDQCKRGVSPQMAGKLRAKYRRNYGLTPYRQYKEIAPTLEKAIAHLAKVKAINP